MIIKNAAVYTADGTFVNKDIFIKNGLFADPEASAEIGSAEENAGEEVIDGTGCYAIPGLVDIHFHGCMGDDFCDGTQKAVHTLAKYEAAEGITAICPATLTLSVEELKKVLAQGAEFNRQRQAEKTDPWPDEADLVGVNMEGPFISKVKKGAQNPNYIIPCDKDVVEEFLEASGGLLKIIGLAPEDNPGFREYIHAVKDKVRVSLAHSNAGYEDARAAFDAGASHAVHLFNAMTPLLHRDPGAIGAASDSPHVFCEIICDGIHVHPAAVRAAFRLMGEERMVLISDSLRAAGLGDGIIDLGGQDVEVHGRLATLVKEGNIAGSVTNLMNCMRYAVQQMELPLETAVRCATINPARAIGIEDLYGSIETGKKGHVVLLRKEDLSTAAVIKSGHVIS